MKLSYWNIRGKTQCIRLFLVNLAIDFQDKRYQNFDDWFKKDKEKIGMPFPNLPFLTDGNFLLSQSSAIPRYIAKKTKNNQMFGKSIQDQARVDQILGVLQDINKQLYGLIFGNKQNFDNREKIYQEKIKIKVDNIFKFMDKHEWILGYLTYVDFVFQQYLNISKIIFPKFFDDKSQNYLKRFQNLPKISEFYKNSKNKLDKLPFMPPGKGNWPN